MHDDIPDRLKINPAKYLQSFYQWKQEEGNSDKNSVDFDKDIGIGEWKKIQISEWEKTSTFKIKDKKIFFLAILKYNIL
jgi:hypothetical protein